MDLDTANWKSEDGEDLLDEVLSVAQRHAFEATEPTASEARAGAQADVEKKAEQLRESGEDRKARQLKRTFKRLQQNAVETDLERGPIGQRTRR
jgi:hypothetical protein